MEPVVMTNIHGDEAFQIEAAGAKACLNPMFGEWRQRFAFPPVPHRGSGGPARTAFQAKIQEGLTNRSVFWGEVQVIITLYLDVQTVLETSDTADVDNYAKGILDALKGPKAILIDDTQVQALTVSWIDSHETYFEVEIRSSPDDFMIKPVGFYEMPDGLYYPQPEAFWDKAGPVAATDMDLFAGLTISEMMAGGKKRMRHVLRQAGMTRLNAGQATKPIETQLRGFHRSRLFDAGYELVGLDVWRARRSVWAEADAARGTFLTEMAAKHRATIERLAEAMAAAGKPSR